MNDFQPVIPYLLYICANEVKSFFLWKNTSIVIFNAPITNKSHPCMLLLVMARALTTISTNHGFGRELARKVQSGLEETSPSVPRINPDQHTVCPQAGIFSYCKTVRTSSFRPLCHGRDRLASWREGSNVWRDHLFADEVLHPPSTFLLPAPAQEQGSDYFIPYRIENPFHRQWKIS